MKIWIESRAWETGTAWQNGLIRRGYCLAKARSLRGLNRWARAFPEVCEFRGIGRRNSQQGRQPKPE